MEPAFVLHRWPYQDSSLIVELLSREQGRFRVVAKGARRPKSQWRAVLQPFIPLLISSRGRHELQTLTHAEASRDAYPLKGPALYSGFYLNELIQRLTSHYQPVDGLFNDYDKALEQLALLPSIEPTLREFEWQLLCHLGHGFDWFHDEQGEEIIAERTYHFVAEQGFCRSQADQKHVFLGADIQQLSTFELVEPHLLNSMKLIMRQALLPYLGEQPLKSRQLFAQLSQLSQQSKQEGI
ncbi:DNA repair protein RecO [Pseudidiomarina piscicola]|uniref:DNA repair protein RecO n=1 Tax=Pseudidiomarina piscicola TaxID=2614830 RepID=A0A6S6WLN1_9GAMM|nr:DNA repair protein RecO [Pseudidiomarina piscicola]CAB0149849.1 DNA repair protein RecO [Pseudidiomarina piscicola]VZT39295.1 DNA repair protein RecO [Pseudomonas aeruginosa]